MVSTVGSPPWAEILEMPILADLLTLQERMWGRLVDHGRAERLQVAAEQFPAHMVNPVAPHQVGSALRARAWQSDVATPGSMVQMDLEDADGLCSNLVTLRAHMLVRHQFGGEIDWHLRRLRRRRVDGQPQCAHPDPQPRVGVRADQ